MKKIVSMVMALCLLLTGVLPLGSFASEVSKFTGTVAAEPVPFGQVGTMTNVRTQDGLWSKVTIKVLDCQIANNEFEKEKKKYTLKDLYWGESVNASNRDYYRVKLNVVATNFKGKEKAYLNANMPTNGFQSRTIQYDCSSGSWFGGIEGGIYNKATKDIKNGKVVDGEWYTNGTTMKNYTKSLSLTGYVYILGPKNRLEDLCVCTDNYFSQDPTVFMALSPKAYEPVKERVPLQTYGTDLTGKFDSDLAFIPTEKKGDLEKDKSVWEYYNVMKGDAAELVAKLGVSLYATPEQAKSAETEYLNRIMTLYQDGQRLQSPVEGCSITLVRESRNEYGAGIYYIFIVKTVGNKIYSGMVSSFLRDRDDAQTIAKSYATYLGSMH